MKNYLFIGGEFNGQWLEANGDREIVIAELFANTWDMVVYVRQTWVQGAAALFPLHRNLRTQEIYVLDGLSANEATQLINGR